MAKFIINAIAKDLVGPYNVTGHNHKIMFSEFLETCKKVTNSNCIFVTVTDEKLSQHNEISHKIFPLYSANIPMFKDIFNVNVDKALENGLSLRPLEETILDAVAWYEEYYQTKDASMLVAGIKPNDEKELISKL